jgi:hypothetical protein
MFKFSVPKIQAVILIIGLVLLGLYFVPSASAASNEPSSSSNGGKRIVKWVDSQGVTHYGDKLPAQEAGRNNSEMNNQGVVIKRNVKTDASAEQEDQARLAAQRKDNILLASYTKAEEIDLARDRNLQMDLAALQALTVQKENVLARAARNQKTADSFNKRKKPIPDYLSEELKLAKSESVKLDKQIAGRKLSMEETRKRFAEEKARFIELKQPVTSNAALAPVQESSEVAPTTQEATKLQSSKTLSKK